MSGLNASPNTRGQFAIQMKRLTGTCNATMAVDQNWKLSVSLESTESTILFVGPEVIQGLTDAEYASHRTPEYSGPTPTYGVPEWTLGIVSNVARDKELLGFDPDPIIAANGLSEAILVAAGIRASGSPSRYAQAAADLKWAVSSLSATNERVLQELVARNPWILVHEAEYETVVPQCRLALVERLDGGRNSTFDVIPDFVYHQHDDISLVVEIESATKRLLVGAAEASFSVASAPTLHSVFQVAGYKRLFSGPLGSQARRQLGKPDSWTFRYLLVVGSRLQPDFNQRSWASLRDLMFDAGIELRHWDYYIDRLERIAQSARMDNA